MAKWVLKKVRLSIPSGQTGGPDNVEAQIQIQPKSISISINYYPKSYRFYIIGIYSSQ